MFRRVSASLFIFASLVLIIPASAHAAEQQVASDLAQSGSQFTEPTGPNEPNPAGSQPTWTMPGTGSAARVLACTGRTYRPDITTGAPGQRFLTASASQECSTPAFYQELCAKIQRNSGGLDPYWINITGWRCNTNTGPSIFATATKDCATIPRGLYRTGARGKATPVGTTATQTRYGYSAGVTLC